MRSSHPRILHGLVAVLVLVFASRARATDTRVETLGGVNHVITDNFNIWLYPSTAAQYPNHAVLGLGGSVINLSDSFFGGAPMTLDLPGDVTSLGTGIYGGGLVSLGKSRVLGIFASDAADDFAVAPIQASQRFDLVFGVQNRKGALGIQVGQMWALERRSNNAFPQSTFENYDRSVGLWTIRLGASSRIGLGKAEAAFELSRLNFTDEAAGKPVSRPGGNLLWTIRARLFNVRNSQITVVPNLEFRKEKMGAKMLSPTTGQDTSRTENVLTTIAAGAGVLYKPRENYLVVIHVFVFRVDDKTETTSPTTASESLTRMDVLPGISAGVEGRLLKWLDVRFGFVKWMGAMEVESGTSFRKASIAPFDWALGLGIHIGEFLIDVGMDREFIRRGPYILSGETGRMFPKATVTFGF